MIPLAVFVFFLTASTTAICPPGSIHDSYLNKCYLFVTTPKSFLDAEEYCISVGGHLADVENAFENSYINGMASGAGSKNFWIGANLLRYAVWSWTSLGYSSLGYTNWALGEPNNANQCGLVTTSNQQWSASLCYNQLPFMCTISPNTTQPGNCPTQPSVPGACPIFSYCSGYYLYTGNCMCYKYYKSNNLTFSDANATCAEEGGMLAKIPSQDVNDFLTALSGIETDNRPWIGLSCAIYNNASSCSWVDGTSVEAYSNFYQIWPSPYLGSAVNMTTGFLDYGKWVYTSQTDTRAYICQRDSIKQR